MRFVFSFRTNLTATIFCILIWNISPTTGGKSFSKIFKKKSKRPCDEETLVNLLAEIQVINPETIINLSTMNKVKPLCEKVSENLEKMEDLLTECEPPNQPDLYLQLVKGVEILYRKLCTDSPFRKQFEQHFNCLHKFSKEFDKCNGTPDWMENSDADVVCKEYKKIASCYYNVAGTHCGQEAADVMKDLVISIINSILTVKCDLIDIGANPDDAIEMEIGPSRVKSKKTKISKQHRGNEDRSQAKLSSSQSYPKIVFILFSFTMCIYMVQFY